MGLGRQVIWTCRDDDLKNVHFDTRQYNHIVGKNQGTYECNWRIESKRRFLARFDRWLANHRQKTGSMR